MQNNLPNTENKQNIEQKRRRGAPPGNHNALRHGLYSRLYRQSTLLHPDGTQDRYDLSDEIANLRLVLHRLLELAGGVEDLDALIKILAVSGQTSIRVALLCDRQQRQGTGLSEAAGAISAALAEVVEEQRSHAR